MNAAGGRDRKSTFILPKSNTHFIPSTAGFFIAKPQSLIISAGLCIFSVSFIPEGFCH